MKIKKIDIFRRTAADLILRRTAAASPLRRTAAALLLTAAGLGAASAQSVDAARTLAEDGDMEGAIAMMRQVVEAEPKNNDAAMLLADWLSSDGRPEEAIAIYENLRRKGVHGATLRLAEEAYDVYDLDKARTLLEAYRKSLKQGKKTVGEDLSGSLDDQIDRAEMMLDRVQSIEVIDSVMVDAEDFFRHFPISGAAGRIGGSEMVPQDFPKDASTVAHVTESGSRMVWSGPSEDGASQVLYGSWSLLGGEWEAPQPLGDNLTRGGEATNPYLMPDGVTLYFAGDGADTLGGYDIFVSRQDEDGFLEPANVGMPFNSPFNDYMLVVDEATGAGWFASDRNRVPGKVTIYTYIPTDMRVNVDVDNPALKSLALLDNIALTQKPGADYSELRRQIAANTRRQEADPGKTDAPTFLFALPGGKVCTSLADFKSPGARKLMQQYLAKEAKFVNIQAKLEELRRLYASGDHSNAKLILEFEEALPGARQELQTLRNSIIEAER